MKNLFVTSLLLLLSMASFAQLKESDQMMYQSKVQSYTKMKKTGSTMAIVGGGLTVVSTVLLASADWEKTETYTGETQYNTTDGSGVLGIVGLVIGVPMAVTGIILNSVGNRKMKYYQDKLSNVKLSSFQQGQQAGITLAIKF
ncbi:MAG: hypothetical protein JEZ14_17120 [Marinilabiliaceae bacterium]|nr:hypothetical protein [Marinilabiliaceae bacterium]